MAVFTGSVFSVCFHNFEIDKILIMVPEFIPRSSKNASANVYIVTKVQGYPLAM